MNKSAAEVVARLAAQAIDEKKGENVVLLDLREITTAPAQWFVIASGNVTSHVSALADAVYEVVKKATGEMPKKVEGYDNAEWVLLDYFDVVVHVFQKDKREYYRLDELWADGKRVEFGEKK